MDSEKITEKGYGSRLKEMTAVLKKHKIDAGTDPGEAPADPGGAGANLYQAGTDYVPAFGYSAGKIL